MNQDEQFEQSSSNQPPPLEAKTSPKDAIMSISNNTISSLGNRKTKRKKNNDKLVILKLKRKKEEVSEPSILMQNEKQKSSKTFKLVNTIEINNQHEEDLLIKKAINSLIKNKKNINKYRKNSSHPQKADDIINAQKQQFSDRQKEIKAKARYEIISKSRILPEEDSSDEENSTNTKVKVYDVARNNEIEYEIPPLPELGSLRQNTDIENLQKIFEDKLLITKDNAEEYVYDFYEIDAEAGEHEIGTIQPKATLSWTRFDSSDEDSNYQMDSESEQVMTDDQDSNDENFYANDYPDEDEYSDNAYQSEHSESDFYNQPYYDSDGYIINDCDHDFGASNNHFGYDNEMESDDMD